MSAENEILEAGMKDNYKSIETAEPASKTVHQCPACFTIYDAQFGDILNEIEAGIPFKTLPETYCCPTCETPKKQFKAVEIAFESNNIV
jgi:rubredoxin